DADDTCLETALLLKNIASRDQNNDIKFYFTSQAGEAVNTERRKALVKDCEADLLVGLSASGEGNDGLTCYYNDRFFLRRLSNARFADMVERNSAAVTGGAALGVVPAKEDELLETSVIPSARLEIGHTDDKVAEGIYNAVLEAFEVME
ncbi:MAG: hypothetical protein J6Z09_05065, partial [Lachnospiraceae bacterium]|nr:hypothetical protein [Lachnospiraceae bacterium]